MKRFFFFDRKKRQGGAEPSAGLRAPTLAGAFEAAVSPNERPDRPGQDAVLVGSCAIADAADAPAVLGDPTLLPGSDGEHALQSRYGSESRAHGFYHRQVLDHLSPLMQEFIVRQEFLFVATADRHGECDCTSKFGRPGFIRVLGDKYLMYPEYRGNGVFANLGNITENPHIALLIIDFYRDTVGLHVNGKACIVENEELLAQREQLSADVLAELAQEGKKRPERWVMVEVEEAYIQCSKHIPRLQKLDKQVDWGTDDVVAKGGDYFHLQEIPLYERVGGDRVMARLVEAFYQRVLQDERVGHFFRGADGIAQRLEQKSLLAMAFGGPYHYSASERREALRGLISGPGMSDGEFDRVLSHFRGALEELSLPLPETEQVVKVLETFRIDLVRH